LIVEIVRLLFTLATTALGFKIGSMWTDIFPGSLVEADVARVWGALLGAGIGYVLGGVIGRYVSGMLDRAPDWFEQTSGPELFAGGFGVMTGVVVGVVVAAPLVALLPGFIGWPLAAMIVLIVAALGGRVFAARAGDVTPRFARSRLTKAGNGAGAFLVDSAAAIDGRVLELARAGLVTGRVWAAAFVVDELQGIADAGDKERRKRGRRGLDILEALRTTPGIDFLVVEDSVPEHSEVDAKLIALAQEYNASLITTDHNLARVASLRGLAVVNPHQLGESLRPMVASGDLVAVAIVKEGSEAGQGVGFLEDGTMVVVTGAADSIGSTVQVEISNTLRTSVGRMAFAHLPE
jgi:uncharacterized protein YacL